MLQNLGATPVTLSFSEVYSALGNGVVDCGVTSANSGNSGKWPEVTQYFYPLAVAGSVQGHFVNLDFWKKLNPHNKPRCKPSSPNGKPDVGPGRRGHGGLDCLQHRQTLQERYTLQDESGAGQRG
jgi:hypothetical protein